jgi:leucyl/phenylalanyl-tRNA--protein transferase
MTTIDPLMLLRAYAMGVFPMADSADDPTVFWVEPDRRAVLPLERFHLSRTLRRTLVRDRFHVTADRAFARVLHLCGEPTVERPATWINETIARACLRLHELGHAHSIECWDEERLVGGLYGISLGRAFFGESMFSRRTDASKVALAWLVARLRVGGFRLLDCQFMTTHLRSLGAVEISRADYSAALAGALAGLVSPASASFPAGEAGDFAALDAPDLPMLTVSGPLSGQLIAQLLTQTS